MANISDINAECRSLTDSTTITYTAADLLRRINTAYETVISWILGADGRWQMDDSNYSDMAIGTGTLVEGQTSYTFATDFLDIEEVDVLNTSGVYYRLRPIDPSELGDVSIEEYFGITTSSTPKGLPIFYDKKGDTVKLYPAPSSSSVILVNGIKVHFKRTADLYTSSQVTTGTKEPGFASPFHMVLAYMAAIPFCVSYKKDRVALYEKKVEDMKRDIIKYYGRREEDRRKVMSNAPIAFR